MTPLRPASAPDGPVARLTSPGDIAAAVPVLCGFVPHESLVLVSLRGPRRRVGLTARIDLDDADRPMLAELAERLRRDGADRALVVVVTEEPGHRPRADVVAGVRRALRRVGTVPEEQLLVRGGRWWSYACDGPCCPPGGTPVPEGGGAGLVAAARALGGRAVLPSREALVAGVAPPEGAAARRAAARLLAASSARAREVARSGRVVVGRAALQAWRGALRGVADGVGPADAAALVVALEDVVVRDEVLTAVLEDGPALVALLHLLAAQAVPPHDAAVCAALGWAAHAEGDGALARVALERALRADPRHGLARLGRDALDGQVPPADLRAVLADARTVLRQQHPWTVP
ncbi:MAG TPA: DUF4192 domain-containing protein [Mycobacteriales bacterium]|nr:DUF4192 domain-containing protein [Mycobacteriales bacterium]